MGGREPQGAVELQDEAHNCGDDRLRLQEVMGLSLTLTKTGQIVRRFAVMLALVVFTVGPAADPLICGAELLGFPAESAAHHDGASIDASVDEQGNHHSAPAPHGACVHGHCHHGGVAMAQSQVAAAEPIVQIAALTPAFDTSASPSNDRHARNAPPAPKAVRAQRAILFGRNREIPCSPSYRVSRAAR